MKFCQICGRPLNEGEVCNCQMQQAPRQAAPQQQPVGAPQQRYQQSAPQQYQQAPQQQYRQAPQQPVPPRPAQDGKFVKALKNIPVAFKSFFKNSDKVIATAKAKNDYLLPLLYVAIFFLCNLILGVCFFARMTSLTYAAGLGDLSLVFGSFSVSYFNFGLVLLAAFIMTVFTTVLCVGVRFLSMVIFGKKAAPQALIESFIEFGFHLIPVSCLILVAALLGLATAWLVVPFIGLAASYLVVVFISSALKEAENYPNKLVVIIILTVCVMLAVALSFFMLRVMCSMNYSYKAGSASGYGGYNYSDLLGSLGSLLDY